MISFENDYHKLITTQLGSLCAKQQCSRFHSPKANSTFTSPLLLQRPKRSSYKKKISLLYNVSLWTEE